MLKYLKLILKMLIGLMNHAVAMEGDKTFNWPTTPAQVYQEHCSLQAEIGGNGNEKEATKGVPTLQENEFIVTHQSLNPLAIWPRNAYGNRLTIRNLNFERVTFYFWDKTLPGVINVSCQGDVGRIAQVANRTIVPSYLKDDLCPTAVNEWLIEGKKYAPQHDKRYRQSILEIMANKNRAHTSLKIIIENCQGHWVVQGLPVLGSVFTIKNSPDLTLASKGIGTIFPFRG